LTAFIAGASRPEKPAEHHKGTAGLTLFEHHVADSVALTYLIDDRQDLVGILRIRRI
jgi:hypothetical protein